VRVTIGLPFLNNAPTLADAIRSVFAQTLQDWELILVDDGSSDGSSEIARSVTDSRVRLVSDGRNEGLAARLNQIAQLADCPYIARMDGDDLMHPDRLHLQVSHMDEHATVDVVDTPFYTINASGNPVGVRCMQRIDLTPLAVLRSGVMAHPTVLARREWFRANPYDESFRRAQDRELWARTCRSSVFARLDRPLHFFREDVRGSLGKYLRSNAAARRVVRLHGPALVGRAQTLRLLAEMRLRAGVCLAGAVLGALERLVRARDEPLGAEARAEARVAIDRVLQTPVPGLG
jgi:glycosyltransferase involved in cell wall biosynthesis